MEEIQAAEVEDEKKRVDTIMFRHTFSACTPCILKITTRIIRLFVYS
jgi:hypothetical protein